MLGLELIHVSKRVSLVRISEDKYRPIFTLDMYIFMDIIITCNAKCEIFRQRTCPDAKDLAN